MTSRAQHIAADVSMGSTIPASESPDDHSMHQGQVAAHPDRHSRHVDVRAEEHHAMSMLDADPHHYTRALPTSGHEETQVFSRVFSKDAFSQRRSGSRAPSPLEGEPPSACVESQRVQSSLGHPMNDRPDVMQSASSSSQRHSDAKASSQRLLRSSQRTSRQPSPLGHDEYQKRQPSPVQEEERASTVTVQPSKSPSPRPHFSSVLEEAQMILSRSSAARPSPPLATEESHHRSMAPVHPDSTPAMSIKTSRTHAVEVNRGATERTLERRHKAEEAMSAAVPHHGARSRPVAVSSAVAPSAANPSRPTSPQSAEECLKARFQTRLQTAAREIFTALTTDAAHDTVLGQLLRDDSTAHLAQQRLLEVVEFSLHSKTSTALHCALSELAQKDQIVSALQSQVTTAQMDEQTNADAPAATIQRVTEKYEAELSAVRAQYSRSKDSDVASLEQTFTARFQALQDETAALQNEKVRMAEHIVRAEKDAATNAALAQSRQAELEERCRAYDVETQSLAQQITTLLEQNKSVRSPISDDVNQRQEGDGGSLAHLQEERDAAVKAVDDLTAKCAEYQSALSHVESEYRELQAEAQRLVKDRDDKIGAQATELKELRTSLQSTEEKLTAARSNAALSSEEAAARLDELRASDDENAQLSSRLEQLQTQLSEKEDTLSSVHAKLEALEATSAKDQTLQEEKIAALRGELESEALVTEELRTTVRQVSTENKTLTRQLAKLQADNTRSTEELRDELKAEKQRAIQGLQSDIAQAQAERQSTADQLQKMKALLQTSQVRADRVTKERDTAVSMVEQLHDERSVLENNVFDLQASLAAVDDSMLRLREENDQLVAEAQLRATTRDDVDGRDTRRHVLPASRMTQQSVVECALQLTRGIAAIDQVLLSHAMPASTPAASPQRNLDAELAASVPRQQSIEGAGSSSPPVAGADASPRSGFIPTAPSSSSAQRQSSSALSSSQRRSSPRHGMEAQGVLPPLSGSRHSASQPQPRDGSTVREEITKDRVGATSANEGAESNTDDGLTDQPVHCRRPHAVVRKALSVALSSLHAAKASIMLNVRHSHNDADDVALGDDEERNPQEEKIVDELQKADKRCVLSTTARCVSVDRCIDDLDRGVAFLRATSEENTQLREELAFLHSAAAAGREESTTPFAANGARGAGDDDDDDDPKDKEESQGQGQRHLIDSRVGSRSGSRTGSRASSGEPGTRAGSTEVHRGSSTARSKSASDPRATSEGSTVTAASRRDASTARAVSEISTVVAGEHEPVGVELGVVAATTAVKVKGSSSAGIPTELLRQSIERIKSMDARLTSMLGDLHTSLPDAIVRAVVPASREMCVAAATEALRADELLWKNTRMSVVEAAAAKVAANLTSKAAVEIERIADAHAHSARISMEASRAAISAAAGVDTPTCSSPTPEEAEHTVTPFSTEGSTPSPSAGQPDFHVAGADPKRRPEAAPHTGVRRGQVAPSMDSQTQVTPGRCTRCVELQATLEECQHNLSAIEAENARLIVRKKELRDALKNAITERDLAETKERKSRLTAIDLETSVARAQMVNSQMMEEHVSETERLKNMMARAMERSDVAEKQLAAALRKDAERIGPSSVDLPAPPQALLSPYQEEKEQQRQKEREAHTTEIFSDFLSGAASPPQVVSTSASASVPSAEQAQQQHRNQQEWQQQQRQQQDHPHVSSALPPASEMTAGTPTRPSGAPAASGGLSPTLAKLQAQGQALMRLTTAGPSVPATPNPKVGEGPGGAPAEGSLSPMLAKLQAQGQALQRLGSKAVSAASTPAKVPPSTLAVEPQKQHHLPQYFQPSVHAHHHHQQQQQQQQRQHQVAAPAANPEQGLHAAPPQHAQGQKITVAEVQNPPRTPNPAVVPASAGSPAAGGGLSPALAKLQAQGQALQRLASAATTPAKSGPTQLPHHHHHQHHAQQLQAPPQQSSQFPPQHHHQAVVGVGAGVEAPGTPPCVGAVQHVGTVDFGRAMPRALQPQPSTNTRPQLSPDGFAHGVVPNHQGHHQRRDAESYQKQEWQSPMPSGQVGQTYGQEDPQPRLSSQPQPQPLELLPQPQPVRHAEQLQPGFAPASHYPQQHLHQHAQQPQHPTPAGPPVVVVCSTPERSPARSKLAPAGPLAHSSVATAAPGHGSPQRMPMPPLQVNNDNDDDGCDDHDVECDVPFNPMVTLKPTRVGESPSRREQFAAMFQPPEALPARTTSPMDSSVMSDESDVSADERLFRAEGHGGLHDDGSHLHHEDDEEEENGFEAFAGALGHDGPEHGEEQPVSISDLFLAEVRTPQPK